MNSIKAFLFVGLTFLLLCAAGCKKTKTGTFVLQLKGSWGSQGFVEDSFYVDPAGHVLTFSNFTFYLSHINLVKTDGSIVSAAPVAYFSFNNPGVLTVQLNNVDGDFKALTFGCGVDSIQNLFNPGAQAVLDTISADNPLNGNFNMHWPMLNYEFEVVDGKWDTAALPLMRNPLTYHIGTNAVYHNTTVNHSFSVCCGKTTTLNLNLDVRKIFYGNTDTLNVADPLQSTTQMGIYDRPSTGATFALNFSQAFSITQ
jgi:hypothetical protein